MVVEPLSTVVAYARRRCERVARITKAWQISNPFLFYWFTPLAYASAEKSVRLRISSMRLIAPCI